MNRQNVNKIAMQKMHSRYAKIIVALVRGSIMLVSEGEKPHIVSTSKGQSFGTQSQKVEGCAIEIVLHKSHCDIKVTY